MRFEFEPSKSAANKAKHGIDFVEAQALWADTDRLEVAAKSSTDLDGPSSARLARRRGQLSSHIAMKTRSASSRSAARVIAKKRSIAAAGASRKRLSAEELDALHASGADMSDHLDWSTARRPGREVQRVNVDFPMDLLRAIDQEAKRIGVTRQAFIKIRLADTLNQR